MDIHYKRFWKFVHHLPLVRLGMSLVAILVGSVGEPEAGAETFYKELEPERVKKI